MTDAERKNIEDVNHEIGLFDGDPIQSTQSFMDKAYGKAWHKTTEGARTSEKKNRFIDSRLNTYE